MNIREAMRSKAKVTSRLVPQEYRLHFKKLQGLGKRKRGKTKGVLVECGERTGKVRSVRQTDSDKKKKKTLDGSLQFLGKGNQNGARKKNTRGGKREIGPGTAGEGQTLLPSGQNVVKKG